MFIFNLANTDLLFSISITNYYVETYL